MRWRYQETVLTLCTVAFFVTMVGRLAISPIIPDISADLDISNAMIGGALTAMWVAYALVQFPSGVLADRFGERVVILASVVGTGLTTLLIGGRAGVRALRPGRFSLAWAAGLHYSVATALITRTYDDIGTAIGLHNAGGPVAGLVTPIVVAWVAVSYGWRVAIGLTAVLAVVVAVLFWWGSGRLHRDGWTRPADGRAVRPRSDGLPCSPGRPSPSRASSQSSQISPGRRWRRSCRLSSSSTTITPRRWPERCSGVLRRPRDTTDRCRWRRRPIRPGPRDGAVHGQWYRRARGHHLRDRTPPLSSPVSSCSGWGWAGRRRCFRDFWTTCPRPNRAPDSG